MERKVAITGLGIVSAIGMDVQENYNSLISKKDGISRVENFSTIHKEVIKVGEIKLTNEELIDKLGLPKINNYSRTALLAEVAALEAVEDAGIQNIQAYKTGFISSTSVGGMDMTERYFYSCVENKEERRYIPTHSAGDATSKVARRLGITEFVTTISTACSSATNAIMLGARMIKAGKLDRVIVGGADCLSKFTINGFKTLMILSEDNCRPFDKDRTGLNLGEAAAFLVLEAEDIAIKEGKNILAYVSGYANANDAFHQTASSGDGEGAGLAMEQALKVAGLHPSEIDYINAHGTATANNDLSESMAIVRVFKNEVPDISSTKAFTGHTLAAAGAIEAIYSVLALQNNIVFPNLNFENSIEETKIKPITEPLEKELNHVLSNSFGFGGNCASVIFSKAN